MGCNHTQNRAERSLRIHLPIVKLNLDPQQMEDAYSMAIVGQIHRGLFRYDMTGTVLPDLAESWTESADHLVYRIKLKPSLFSDGTPLKPVHVQMTFARMFHLAASMAGDLDFIAGAAEFRKDGDITKLGVVPTSSDTVEFRLARPSAIFLKQLAVADCAVLRMTDYKQNPDLSEKGAFSGPFKVIALLKDNQLTIGRWRKDPMDSPNPPEQITYFMTAEKPLALAKAGATDTLDHDRITPDELTDLQAQGWAATPTEISGELFVLMNPDAISEPTRRAMYAAASKVDPSSVAPKSAYRRAYGLIPFGLPGELSASDVQSVTPEAAVSTSAPIKIDLDYEETSDLERRLALLLRDAWAQVNVVATPVPLPKAEKLKRLFGKKSQAIIGRKTMDYPDGFSVLGYFKGNYDSNYFFVNDPGIDRALAESLQIFDSGKREAQYREIQKLILKKWTTIPLLFGSEASGLWSNKLRTVPAHPFGYHMLPMESVELAR